MASVTKYGPLCDVIAECYRGGSADDAFDERVAAWRMDLLREWQLVFHEKSRHLWSDEHRANALRAVANAARRVTGT